MNKNSSAALPALSALMGATYGGLTSPSGHRWEGAGRGALGGLATGGGAAVGALGGGLAGAASGNPIGHQLGFSGDETMQGLAIGAGVGGLGGAVGGNLLAQKMLGKPSWDVDPKQKQQDLIKQLAQLSAQQK